MGQYNVFNNYWSVGDGPTGQVYSSARAEYVVTTDATYTAWLAAGNTATTIDTYANLINLLNANFQAGTPYGAFISGGLTVTSTSTPALNGVYPIDAATQVNISTEASFITAFSEFTTGGTTALPWQFANGTFLEFPTTVEFLAFAKAVGQVVAAAKLASAQGTAMPAPSVTIA